MSRIRKLYDPAASEPFRLSRSKIALFLECPRCFYLDRRCGVARPALPAFTLNSAVDELLKKEFDLLRQKGHCHELTQKYGLDVVPYSHPDLDIWRENFKGKEYLHPKTNLLICGAIDDIWEDKKGKLFIVDYKSTSTTKEISLEDEYKQGYKKQVEIYQWIFRKGGFDVSNTVYFVFANARKDLPCFEGKLEFNLSIIPYEGKNDWVEPVILKIKQCLDAKSVPVTGEGCAYCRYREEAKI